MSEAQSTGTGATPKHLWIIGAIAVLWNSFGAMDYLMTQTQNEAYVSNFTPEQLEFFYGFPVWVDSSWAIAVWGAVLGSLLLLWRKRVAVQIFLTSIICLVITTFHNFVLSNGMEVMGDPFSLIFTAVIFLVAVALFVYARAMRENGVLT